MSPLDIAVLVVYLAFIGGLAFHFSRRQKSAEDYFLAGRNLPGWVVGFSIMGTVVSSATFVGHPGNVFFSDMWAFAYHLALPVVVLLTVGRFVVFYRRTLRMSPYEYLGTRFGYPAQAYASASFIVSRILDMSLTVYFLGLALAFVTGWDVWWVILVVGLLTVAYTLAGGIRGVVWTDFLQGILLVGGGLLCAALILGRGDAGQLLTTAWEGGKFTLGSWEPSLIEDNFWLLFVGGIFHFLQSFGTDQNMVQRYLLARSDREARRSAMLGILSCVPIWLLFMFLGGLLWAFYQADPSALPPEVGQVKDNIIPHFILTELPPGLLGLLLAGLLAAAMSSMDSDLNSVAAVVLQNFYRRMRPGAAQRRQLMVGRGRGCGRRAAVHFPGATVDRHRVSGEILTRSGSGRLGRKTGLVRPGMALPQGHVQGGLHGPRRLRGVHSLGRPDPGGNAQQPEPVAGSGPLQLSLDAHDHRHDRACPGAGGGLCRQPVEEQ